MIDMVSNQLASSERKNIGRADRNLETAVVGTEMPMQGLRIRGGREVARFVHLFAPGEVRYDTEAILIAPLHARL
jgi:hypothetical protein